MTTASEKCERLVTSPQYSHSPTKIVTTVYQYPRISVQAVVAPRGFGERRIASYILRIMVSYVETTNARGQARIAKRSMIVLIKVDAYASFTVGWSGSTQV